MTKDISFGQLDQRVTIQRNVASTDWSGHAGPPQWMDQFTVWAGIRFLRGSETVLSARLTARQPAVLTVRATAQTKGILASDRAVNARTGEIFNIRELPREARENRGFLQFLVEAGAT